MRANSKTGNRAGRSGVRKKFNVKFIVKTDILLYNRNKAGANCIVSSVGLQ